MPKPSSWQDLRDRYLRVLSGPDAHRPGTWLLAWQLLVTHPWYRAELKSCARRVLKRHRAPLAWQMDLEHDAMLLLARKLREAPDLGVDPAQAQRHFAGWMATIITHDCRQALRRLQGLYRPSRRFPEQHATADDRGNREAWVDLNLALERLDAPERKVITLRLKGFSIRQIAARLHLNYWRAYRLFRRALKTLRRMLR